MATNVATQLAAIKKQKEVLLKKEQALLSKTHTKVLRQIVQMAKDAGLTASDITAAMSAGKTTKTKSSNVGKKTGPRGKVEAKYQNPANPSEKWTGRGVSPKWVAELKAAGTLDSALITKPVQNPEASATH